MIVHVAYRFFSRIRTAFQLLLLSIFALTLSGAIVSIFCPQAQWISFAKDNRIAAFFSGNGQVGFTYMLLIDKQARPAEIIAYDYGNIILRCHTYWPREPNMEIDTVAILWQKPLSRPFRLRSGASDPQPYFYFWLDLPTGARFIAQRDTRPYDPEARSQGTMGPLSFCISFQIPYWLVAAIFAWPAWRSLRAQRRSWNARRRLARGLCPTCGYDLRAHQAGEKCPECGTAVPKPAVAREL